MIPTWQWMTLAIGLAVSAFFSAAETALTSLGDARVSALVERGGGGRGAAGFHDALAVVTGATTFLLLVFGEVTPKAFAKRCSRSVALVLMPLVALVYFLLWPLVMVLVQFPRALTYLARLSPEPPVSSVTSQELEYLIELGARHGSLDKEKEQLLNSVLAFTEVLVKKIMVPRTQVVALAESADYDQVLKLATESELSRIPVYRETMDGITGGLYVKLLLADARRNAAP